MLSEHDNDIVEKNNKIYTFNELVEHLDSCSNLNLKCTNKKCSAGPFPNVDDFKQHIEKECLFARL